MTFIEFKTKSKSTYLVDVVNKKIRFLDFNGESVKDGPWYPYQELQGQGQIDERFTIVWSPEQATETTPVVDLKFVG